VGVRLPSSTTKASVSIVYDDAGERLKVSQPLTTTTTMTRNWTYDEAGRELTFTDAAGTTTTTYNKAGWVTSVADPRPVTVHFGYDDLGRRICRYTAACTASTNGAESWAYDAAGNMTQGQERRGDLRHEPTTTMAGSHRSSETRRSRRPTTTAPRARS
jgi:YD repeat-containing protein